MQDVHVKLIQDCHRKSNIPEEVEEDPIRQQIGHNFKKETSQVPHLEHSFVSW